MSRAARVAVTRWAWRLFRREWRQQVLILTLLSVVVAGAVTLAAAAYNAAPAGNGDFGSSQASLTFRGEEQDVSLFLENARKTFGTIDVVEHEYDAIPGSIRTLDLRSRDPHAALGTNLRLRSGSYPTTTSEVALTQQAATLYGVQVGQNVRLKGMDERVVGIVENPQKLNDVFALYVPNAFPQPASVTVLVNGSMDRVHDYAQDPENHVTSWATPEPNVARQAATAVLSLATVVLLLIALVASASFTAIAHRRLRQLGMFSVAGATPRQMRFVMVANGIIVGFIAGLVGIILGAIAFAVLAPHLEASANHRIDASNIPWWLLLASFALSVVTASMAAWWPARSVSKVSTMMALRSLSPRPKAVHRSTAAGIALCIAGVIALTKADIGATHTTPDHTRPYAIVFGIVATVCGVLLSSPLVVRAFGRIGRHWPIGVRLAVRDLARYQARSAAALASIALALGLSVAIIVVTATQQNPAASGNLSDKQVIVRFKGDGPLVAIASPEQVTNVQKSVDTFAASLSHATVTPLDVAFLPNAGEGGGFSGPDTASIGTTSQIVVNLGRKIDEHSFTGEGQIFIATPEVAHRFGLDLSNGSDYFIAKSGDLYLMDGGGKRSGPLQVPGDHRTALPSSSKYTSIPSAFMTPSVVQQHGWSTQRYGWLIESNAHITNSQLSALRQDARTNGLTLETRDDQRSLVQLRIGAGIAGVLLALGILSMTVGLIRSEAARDLRLLMATGAQQSVGRTITATTAGVLALGGVVLGVMTAYIALCAAYAHRLHILRAHIPLPYLIAEVVGVPLIAALCGWLLASRQPETLPRSVLDS